MENRVNVDEVLPKVDGVKWSFFFFFPVTNSVEILQKEFGISVMQLVKC